MLTEELSAILPGDPIPSISVIEAFIAHSSAKYLGMNEACVCLDSPAVTEPCSHSASPAWLTSHSSSQPFSALAYH